MSTAITHLRTTSLPSTTGRLSKPLFRTSSGNSIPLSLGGLGAIGTVIAGACHVYSANNEESSLLSWSNALRILGWGSLAGLIFNYTMPPKNSFQTDLINNGVKDLFENIIEKLGDKNSFPQILSDNVLRNLNRSSNKIAGKVYTILERDFEENKESYEERENDVFRTPRNRLRAIFNKEDKLERFELFKDLLKENGYLLFSMIHEQKKDVYKNCINEIFPEKSESQEISEIRDTINKIIEPVGLSLHSVQVERKRRNNELTLHFVHIKGHGDENKNALLNIPGYVVSLNSEDFFGVLDYLIDHLDDIRSRENIKSVLEGNNFNKESVENLSREILSRLDVVINHLNSREVIKAAHIVYDPKARGYTSQDIIDSVKNMLNEFANISIRRFRKAIGHGSGSSIIGHVGGLGGTSGYTPGAGFKANNNNDDENPNEELEGALAGKGGKRNTAGTTDYADINKDEPISKKKQIDPEIEQEKKNGRELLNRLLTKDLGIMIKPENTTLVKLKLALISLELGTYKEKFVRGEKEHKLRINAFWEKHEPEIERKREEINNEICKRKEATNKEEINHELESRLEEYIERLFNEKFYKEYQNKEIQINSDKIDSIELSKEEYEQANNAYLDRIEAISYAISELLPTTKDGEDLGLGAELELKPHAAGKTASAFGLEDFITIALEGAISRKINGPEFKVNDEQISIVVKDRYGKVEEKILDSKESLFYELARVTPNKNTDQAMFLLERLFKVLDKNQAAKLREEAQQLKKQIDNLSEQARGNTGKTETPVENKDKVNV